MFHSCRLNDEVAVETVSLFSQMWESVPEPIHLKILAIIDRYERRRGEKRREEKRRGEGEEGEEGEGEGEGKGWEVRCGRASPSPYTSKYSR